MRKLKIVVAVFGIGFLIVAGGCSKKKEESSTKKTEETPMADELTIHEDPVDGEIGGHEVTRYLMKNKNGMTVTMMNYGATVLSVQVPDRNGKIDEITLGFKNYSNYTKNKTYFGGTCGRFSNRIAKGKFTIDGKEYQLATNNDPNHLHGGVKGFNNALWTGEIIDNKDEVGVKFTYISPDGEEGYPGKLTSHVTYSLNDNNELKIDYTATVTGNPTHVNLTNHCYWNLAGEGTILNHEVTLPSLRYLPVDGTMIPTGELKAVKGTPFDFTSAHTIGERYEKVKIGEGEGVMTGYDHCYILDKNLNRPASEEKLVLAAHVYEPKTGRVMEVLTDQPGIQFYIGVFLDGSKDVEEMPQYGGFCLESQKLPDAPNQTTFPPSLIIPGEIYRQTTIHRFSVKK